MMPLLIITPLLVILLLMVTIAPTGSGLGGTQFPAHVEGEK